jgi:asparagine synthase (glutamine-hydrolysing)
MCGIAGILGGAAGDTRRAIEEMTRSMARRGPDASGVKELPGGVLGHRRLAIFDLTDAGAQPMSTVDGAVWVVFNGAIYNFESLRAELEKRGCRFRSDSDTEVLLHGYRAWGVRPLVQRLRGMFAFGLWDNAARKLYLVRDRLGVKPLVFAARGGEIAFASTVRALKRVGYAGEIDEQALLDVLRWGFVGEPRCIYRAVQKLAPATILEWSDGTFRQSRYWEPPAAQPESRICFAEAVTEVERLLSTAVSVRLNADVPVAALLSGGIDSSLICWALADLGADVTAYTIGLPGEPSDESAAAITTARRLGIHHRVLELGDCEMPKVDELLAAFDEPFASSSALGMLQISRAIASSAKVVLTGDGGDDLFLGYPRHRHLWLAEKVSHYIRQDWAETLKRWGSSRSHHALLRRAGALLDYANGGVDAYFKASIGLAAYRERGLLGPSFDGFVPHTQIDSECSNGMVEALLKFERRSRFVGEYLKKLDGATMHHGIEARAPFLDQDLWNFAGVLPIDIRLRRGELKAILRALARRHLGISIAARKKRGFRIPAERWLTSHWLERAEQVLGESILAQAGWIDGRNALAELRASASRGAADAELWNIFVLESWLQHDRRERSDQAALLRNQPAPVAVPQAVSR